MSASLQAFYNSVTVSSGPVPVRAYVEEPLPDFLEGTISSLAGSSSGSCTSTRCLTATAMKEREAIKVMVELSVAPMEVAAQTSHTAARKEGTAMSAWTSDQLDKIAAAEEPRIRTTRREGKAIRIEILKDPTASAQ